MGELTAKQAAFVREYLIDSNGTQAAIRAGYSPKRHKSRRADCYQMSWLPTRLNPGKTQRGSGCRCNGRKKCSRRSRITPSLILVRPSEKTAPCYQSARCRSMCAEPCKNIEVLEEFEAAVRIASSSATPRS